MDTGDYEAQEGEEEFDYEAQEGEEEFGSFDNEDQPELSTNYTRGEEEWKLYQRRCKVAEGLLNGWYHEAMNKGDLDDCRFIQRHLSDLSRYVRENKEELDMILKGEDESNPPKKNRSKKKRGHDDTVEAEEEDGDANFEDSFQTPPPLKKS
jgi:hypothetical protein